MSRHVLFVVCEKSTAESSVKNVGQTTKVFLLLKRVWNEFKLICNHIFEILYLLTLISKSTVQLKLINTCFSSQNYFSLKYMHAQFFKNIFLRYYKCTFNTIKHNSFSQWILVLRSFPIVLSTVLSICTLVDKGYESFRSQR